MGVLSKLESGEEWTKERVFKEASKIEGWFSPGNMETVAWLVKEFSRPQGRMLEIGVWKGRSAFVFAGMSRVLYGQYPPTLFLIDTFAGSVDQEDYSNAGLYAEAANGSAKLLEKLVESLEPFTDHRHILVGSSRKYANYFYPGTLDVVFIDGDHYEPSISADIREYWPAVRPGGVMCGHDFYESDVGPAVIRAFGSQTVQVQENIWIRKKGQEDEDLLPLRTYPSPAVLPPGMGRVLDMRGEDDRAPL